MQRQGEEILPAVGGGSSGLRRSHTQLPLYTPPYVVIIFFYFFAIPLKVIVERKSKHLNKQMQHSGENMSNNVKTHTWAQMIQGPNVIQRAGSVAHSSAPRVSLQYHCTLQFLMLPGSTFYANAPMRLRSTLCNEHTNILQSGNLPYFNLTFSKRPYSVL